MRSKTLFLAILGGLLLASCDPGSPKEEIKTVSSVSLSQSTAEMLPGETIQLLATVLPADASDKSVTWASSKQSVATVSSSGQVTAVAVGTSTITASSGGKSATCQVTVSKAIVAVEAVSLDRREMKLSVGEESVLRASVSPADATDRALSWTSSNTAVVTVDQGGCVKACAEGLALVTATAGGKSASCQVQVSRGVIPVISITLDRTSVSLETKQTTTLIATVSPSDATDKTVTWSTSNAEIATVGQDGLVTAVREGRTIITASAGSKSATCEVTVKKQVIPVSSITLSRTSLSLTKGQSETLTATVSPADATDKVVTWTSSDMTLVSVDQNGKVTALKGGSVTVTASAGEKSATCAVEVTVPVESVSLDRMTLTLEENQTTTLIATVNPSDATEKTVTWSSSDESFVTVDQNGKVTAVREGMANIIAQAGGKRAVCSVSVTKGLVPVTSVVLDKTRLNLTVGSIETLTATVNPSDATDKTVSWSSTDLSVATVDQNGKVTALKGGTATIRASAGDQSATAFVDVLEVTPGSVELEGKGGRFDVTVICQRGYHLSSKPDWVTELSVEGQVHHYEAQANDSDQDRSGVVSFCDDEGTCLACVVRQKGYSQLDVDPDYLYFEIAGGQLEVQVASTFDWTVTSDQGWCAVTPAAGSHNGSFTVAVDEYRVEGARTATLSVKGGNLVRTISVEQEGIIPFSVSPTSVELGEEGGSFEVKVRSNVGYHISDKPDWVSEVSGQGKIHVFRVGANTSDELRRGVVSFCDDEGTCLSVSVIQAAHMPGPDEVNWNRDFYHRSLFMDFTATWCGYCPMMATAVKQAQAQMPGKIEVVGVHGSGSALEFQPYRQLETPFGVSGYPTGIMDARKRIPNYTETSVTARYITQAVNEKEKAFPTVTAVGLRSVFSVQKLNVEAYLFFKKAGQYKVTVLLLEDGIVSPQSDYVEETTHQNYVHDGVARVALTNVLGESISVGSDQTKLTRNYSVTIPSSYVKDKLRILVFIQRAYGSMSKISNSDFDGYFVDNCVSAKAGNTLLPSVYSDAGGGNEDVTEGDPINW